MVPTLQQLQGRYHQLTGTRGNLPCFVDFEASSLGHMSYPIEVAWSDEDGRIESHLINPNAAPGWADWDPQAERIHGVSRQRLQREGQSPRQVAERLNACLAGKTLYCDGGQFDHFWLYRLYQAARLQPSFKLADCGDLFERYLSTKLLEDLARLARQATPDRHRAAVDVNYLQLFWSLILAECHRLSQPSPLPTSA